MSIELGPSNGVTSTSEQDVREIVRHGDLCSGVVVVIGAALKLEAGAQQSPQRRRLSLGVASRDLPHTFRVRVRCAECEEFDAVGV
jgi:hypothetical protein